jgi:hypothetical protein
MSYPSPHRLGTIILSVLILLTHFLIAAEPEENTIPIIGMRASNNDDFSGIGLRLLCELSWKHFDGVEVEGPVVDGSAGQNWEGNRAFIELCGDAGMLLVLAPWEICQFYNFWNNNDTAYWFRWEEHSLNSGKCFGQLSETLGAPVDSMTALQMADTTDVRSVAYANNRLAATLNQPAYSALWFYNVYDEAPARQRAAMVDGTSSWDDWIPNLYTQDMSGGEPTLTEIEPAGIYSWQKWLAENNAHRNVPFTINFSLLHTIYSNQYTGLTGNLIYGSMHQQANSVRALCEALYQGPQVIPSAPADNSPEFICFDYYPFRYVDIAYSSSTTLCDSDWLFLVDHFEEGMDSTVFAARESGVPVFFYPQAFGTSGGPQLRNGNGDLHYHSYAYRTPAPQEFRMLCNLALLHQAKGLFPYSLASYLTYPGNPTSAANSIKSSLLDLHGIPFDAPYEDWVYTGRWPDTGDWEGEYEYADPRELPPFCSGFDPLYTLPPGPSLIPGYPRNRELWYTWFFEPYARLYNSVEVPLAEAAVIAPEMAELWWFEENGTPYWDVAKIVSVENPETYSHYVSPAIKVFHNPFSNHIYLYYVNRYLRNEATDYTISIVVSECPGQLHLRVLDHNRRFLVPAPSGGVGNNVFLAFTDTLEAGEGRLVEFVDENIPADIRVTSPDVFAIREGSLNRTGRLVCTAGETLTLGAVYYNMGTEATGNVTVTFTDLTEAEVLGMDTIRLGGLSGFYSPDSVSASIQWATDVSDVGVHRVEISAGTLQGENTSDNRVTVTVLVEPLDYATEVLGNPWDMTEAVSNPPDWFTNDIAAVSNGWVPAAWTDSISGMFEGALSVPASGQLFRGDIYLREDSHEPIDADRYTMLSMAGVSKNPNSADTGFGCGMFLFWTDSDDQTFYYPLHSAGAFGRGLGNGREMWREFGPLDLSGEDGWSGEIHGIGIRFQMEPPDEHLPVFPIGIRLGWVRLEEGAL